MPSILIVTLPTRPNAARVPVRRALKALGAAGVRDAANALPSERPSPGEPEARRRRRGESGALQASPQGNAGVSM